MISGSANRVPEDRAQSIFRSILGLTMQDGEEFVVADGLDQMMIESCGTGPASIFILAVARDGDNQGIFAILCLLEPRCDVVAVHPGKAEVE